MNDNVFHATPEYNDNLGVDPRPVPMVRVEPAEDEADRAAGRWKMIVKLPKIDQDTGNVCGAMVFAVLVKPYEERRIELQSEIVAPDGGVAPSTKRVWTLRQLGDTVWNVEPALGLQGMGLFVTICKVPTPAPWQPQPATHDNRFADLET